MEKLSVIVPCFNEQETLQDYYDAISKVRETLLGKECELQVILVDDASVIVTHEMRFAREVSDRVLFMAEGNILEQGAPEQIFNNPTHPRLQDFLKKVL